MVRLMEYCTYMCTCICTKLKVMVCDWLVHSMCFCICGHAHALVCCHWIILHLTTSECVCVGGGGGGSQDVVYSLFTLAGPCTTVPLTILQAAARAMAQSVVLHWLGPLLLLFIILAHQLPQLFLFLHPFGAVVYNGVVTSEGFCLALVIALISKRSFMKISLKLNESQSAYHVQYQHTRDKCHRNTAKTRVA